MLHFAVCCHCGQQLLFSDHHKSYSDTEPVCQPKQPFTPYSRCDGSERTKSHVALFMIMYNFPLEVDWWVGNGRLAQRREDLEDSEGGESAFSDISALHIQATDGNGVLRHPGATPGHPGIAQDHGGAGGHLFAGLNRLPHPSSPRRARLSPRTCAVRMGCIYIGVRYGRSQCGA